MQTLCKGEKRMDEKEKITEINLSADLDNVSEDIQDTGKKRRKNYTVLNNKFFTQDLIDTPIYNEELMENVLVGIAQNIWLEMDRQGLSIRGLAALRTLSSAQCSCFKPIRFDRRLKIRREAGCFGLISCWRSADAPRSVKHIPFSLRPTVHKTDSQFRPSYRWYQ